MKHPGFNRLTAITCLALAALLIAPVVCAEFQIYKVKGNVSLKRGQKTLQPARRTALRSSDILTIPADGAIDILDSDSRRIYSSTQTGNMTVQSLVEKARSQASSITRNINKKVIAAVSDNANGDKGGYDVIGMAIHETDALAAPPVALAPDKSYLAYLLEETSDPDAIHQKFISLSMVPCDGENASQNAPFNFSLYNNTRLPLYFNVIECSKGDNIALYFTQNLMVAPKSETVASSYTYLPDKSESGYIAIASDIDFTPDDVKKLLQAGYDPEECYFLTILTPNPQ